MHSCDGVPTLCLQLQREVLSYYTEQATKAVCKGFRNLGREGRRERHGVKGCEVGGHEGRKQGGVEGWVMKRSRDGCKAGVRKDS